jgi:IS605 OrfB family transposase
MRLSKPHQPWLRSLPIQGVPTLTAAIELLPSAEQAKLLLRTMAAVNAAATCAAGIGAAERTFSLAQLHVRAYKTLRERFGLSAQQSVHAIRKAVAQFTREPGKAHRFRTTGSVPLDARSVSYKTDAIGVLTLEGRIDVAYRMGAHQHEALLKAADIGGATLSVRRDGRFVLGVSYETVNEARSTTVRCLGVDRGLVNIATTSDGETFVGAELERKRARRRDVRGSMQRKAAKQKKACKRPKSLRRRLKKMSGRESRLQRDVNHCISKKLVQRAKGTDRAIALENLKGIGGRTRFHRTLRRRLGGWAFHQLGLYVKYKAERAGVPVVEVDPRNTSRECPRCGHAERANRHSQAVFRCRGCGHTGHADCVAAENIRRRGERQLARSREKGRELTLAA